ncbi:MAG: hypothetical protein O3B01_25030 [Planctomycetota bacterium]|nr:hypothetical protein [Planctomycetota bacterium]
MQKLRLRFLCKSCGKPLRSKVEQESKPFKCPFCGVVQTVPSGIPPTASNAEHQAVLREQERQETSAQGGSKIQLQVTEDWQPQFVNKEQKKSNIELYFQLVIRGIQRMTTECMRMLENDKLTAAQKKNLIQGELDSNYQEVVRFREMLQGRMDQRKSAIRQHVEEHAVRFDNELERMNKEMRGINLLIQMMFEEYRVGEHLLVPSKKEEEETPPGEPAAPPAAGRRKGDTEILRQLKTV